ncbi:hypothetical protein [Janthinobacterium lividum]|jgi:hypothetical protein|uniref:hypothetical protein n=1 Tax=Janthinobacterium lividum TaxID=29581 RepID=UPI000873BC6B|nr:hypothetical protein [Janthinobacterium lividum]MCC7716987.1 hypothetical protein [Janthinobacterium lividum]WQE31936.1 hypothetical protein U0004_28980 [Janthinobacterium lividum]
MLSITTKVEQMVMESAFLSEGLARGLLNLSELARQLQPQLEKALWKPVSKGAVVTALCRVAERIPQQHSEETVLEQRTSALSMRSDLVVFTYRYSDQTYACQRRLLELPQPERGTFITITHGVNEVMVICSRTLQSTVDEMFIDEQEVARIHRVSAVTLHLAQDTCYTPGIYHAILRRLAWERINLTNIICTFSELTLLLEASQTQAAYLVLSKIAAIR